MQSPFKEGLFPHEEIPFVFAHSPTFSSSKKNAGRLNFHHALNVVGQKEKRGWVTPPPLKYVGSFVQETLEGLSLPLVRSPCQHPTFQKDHTSRNRNRIDIGLSRCWRLQEGIVEGRNSHLPPSIPIVAVPREEHGWNILAHFKESIFIIILISLIP